MLVIVSDLANSFPFLFAFKQTIFGLNALYFGMPSPNLRLQKVINAAKAQVGVTRFYDPAYTSLAYPNGDVPKEKGVCSDVIVRAFRAGGVDLQKVVHDDMKAHFRAYPNLWNLRRPDTNIDHRRVVNLMRFFERKRTALPVSRKIADYHAGDVVAWRLPNGRLHIGLVSDSDGRPKGAADGAPQPLLSCIISGPGRKTKTSFSRGRYSGTIAGPFEPRGFQNAQQ